MRISEIILENELPISSGPTLRIAQRRQETTPGVRELGKGHFAKTYSAPGDLERVIKLSSLDRNNWSLDGYYAYLEAIRQSQELTHNPYLPQIDGIERVQSVREPYIKVTMEHLYPFKNLTRKEAEHVLERIVPRDPEAKQTRRGDYKQKLSWFITFLSSGSKKSRDPQLQSVIDMIRNLGKKYNIDLHDQNFMFRRTPYGPQLVITDPLSFGN